MIKNKFVLLNNLKNDFGQFSYYEQNQNHSIIKNNTIKLILILLLIITIISFYGITLEYSYRIIKKMKLIII